MSQQSVIEKKVGQLFCVGVSGKQLDSSMQKILARVSPGSIIFFKENYESLDQLIRLIISIQKTIIPEAYQGLPALIGVDQEGGRVQRFSAPFSHFPSAAKIGAIQSPKTAFEVGFAIGSELRACGLSVNFAPVVDVPEALDSGVVGDRAYSTDPEGVAQIASGVVRGLQKAGVLAIAKHFPGHGCVSVDSHHDLPVSHKTIEELEARDWIPFKRVTRSKVEGIMTAHILFPQIDPERPATLSRRFIQDQLRKNLRFSRLVFTDDLEMGALRKKYSLSEAAFLAIEAGCDQILVCHQYDQIEVIWEELVRAFEAGALPLEKLNESIERICDAKRRYLLPFQPPVLEKAQSIVGDLSFQAVVEAVRAGRAAESDSSS